MRGLALICLCLLQMTTPLRAAPDQTLKSFFFGNSLVHHLSDSPETSMPYWLGQIARSNGGELKASGKWGFLRDFSAQLPPQPNWTIAGVAPSWSERQGSFATAGVQAVVVNPANFIQYAPAEQLYEGDNPSRESPLTATLKVFDWSQTGAQDMRFFVYEGWAELAAHSRRFPPRTKDYQRYLEANTGAYHRWYTAYVEDLNAARPNLKVQLIPVASTLPRLLALPGLADLEPTDLFTDDAPHGTPTLYLLAAMISYGPLFQADLPTQMVLPKSIHPLLREHYGEVAQTLNQQKAASLRPAATPARVQAQPTVPTLAMGLNGIADWSTQYPFVDVMKTARPWIGHLKGEWGGWDDSQLQAKGHLDEDGWPLSLPPDVERLESFILADLPPDARYFAGRYRLTYRGQGALELVGRATDVSYQPGEIWFSFEPGDGLVALSLKSIDAQHPIRDIQIVREDHIPLLEMGALFNPDWLALVEDLRVLRFMDWMFTNGSPIATWQDRPRASDYTYVRRGVPLEVMIALSNQIGADPWFNMPHKADDAYMRQFAEQVLRDLDPGLKAYVEYSNEMWNFGFQQAQYAQAQAQARWQIADQDAWLQWAGMRAAQMSQIWTEVFGAAAPTRLTRVVATHTGWPGLEEGLLQAPLWRKEDPTQRPPVAHFDAYAVTGYFGFGLGGEDQAEDVLDWLKVGKSEAAKRSYKTLKAQDVAELTQELFPYHSKVARAHGLSLIMYEGGTHVVAHGAAANNPALTAFFTEFNYSQEMAALYAEVMDGWIAAGGTLFNAFVDVAPPSQWGSWGARRHLGDQNPRWDMLMDYAAKMPSDWEPRDPVVFQRGRTLMGDSADNLLEGGPLVDLLIGAVGDDWLFTRGGGDSLHGGDGTDTAVLPGQLADYRFTWAGDFLMADGPEAGELRMYSVEQIEFESDPGQIYALRPRS